MWSEGKKEKERDQGSEGVSRVKLEGERKGMEEAEEEGKTEGEERRG